MIQPLEDVFRDNLKFYRTRAKLSQEKLSVLLDKNINYINMIEGGKSIPPLSVIDQIARILQVEPHYLLVPAAEKEGLDRNLFIEETSCLITSKVQEVLKEIFEKKNLVVLS